ncbi:MAG: DUF4296 domain-containing protein [Bacteroidales bacterium]|nr:DUF4296 domain-containing protein [Candidatus Scybalousia scybalohippi]
MLKKILYILFFVFVVFACSGEEKKEKPIPEEKMVEIFLDLSKAEQLADELTYNKNDRDTLLEMYRQDVFAHHNISEEEYKKQVQLYLNTPKLMEKLSKRLPENSLISLE